MADDVVGHSLPLLQTLYLYLLGSFSDLRAGAFHPDLQQSVLEARLDVTFDLLCGSAEHCVP